MDSNMQYNNINILICATTMDCVIFADKLIFLVLEN